MIKLFTHTDLDGVGCAIIAKVILGRNIVDVEYCDYDNIDDRIAEFISTKDYDNYSHVYITDLSINKENAEKIENTFPDNFTDGFNLGEHFTLLDHHPTALWLNKYFWATVKEIDDETKEKVCGTRLFFTELLDTHEFYHLKTNRLYALLDFVEIVNKYDTWLWKEVYDDIEPKKWNDLFHILGRDRFIEQTIDKIRNHTMFTVTDKLMLELEQEKIDRYIENKQKQMIVENILGYKAGIVFAEQYHSQLGNILSEQNTDLDFVAIVDVGKSVSYRTTKDNIHLGKNIAKIYGGGGHAKAAGSLITNKVRSTILELIFKK